MYKLVQVFAAVLFLGLFSTLMAQHQSGDFYFDSTSPNFTLNTNEGTRTVEKEFKFTKPFESTPSIVPSVTFLDVNRTDAKLRYSVTTQAVSRDGFIH